MAKATRVCKVCGDQYEYCYTLKRGSIFRWQDVACCPEHGSEYFARIETSRAITPIVKPTNSVTNTSLINNVTGDDYGVIDYDEFDDEENEVEFDEYDECDE